LKDLSINCVLNQRWLPRAQLAYLPMNVNKFCTRCYL